MALFIQLVLLAVVSTLTVLVATAAFQVFQILHEFRFTLKKLNKILDNTQTLSEASARPVAAVNNFFTEVKDLVNDTQDQIIEDTPDKIISPSQHKTTKFQRFFKRSGLPLRAS